MTQTAARITALPIWANPEPRSVGRASRPARNRRWLVGLVLGGLLLVGAGLRFDNLGERGMGHVESYTPGIPFPPDISSPAPRLTLWESIIGPVFEEPHPPAWYALTWPWTHVFGTDLVTIRLPSVLLGIAAIALIYQLGVLVHGWPTGLVAAGLLTFNGHHLLFSQVSRPTSLAVVLSMLSTILLLLVCRGGQRRRLQLLSYAVVTLVGLGTLYYFWPILAAQMVWVGLLSARQCRSMRPLLRLQWLLVLLASPLVTLAIFQQFNSFLDSDGLGVIFQFLEFGFLFEPDNLLILTTQPYIPDAVRTVLPIVCAALIVLGIVRTRWRAAGNGPALDLPQISLRGLGLAAVLAFALILCEIVFFQVNRPGRLPRMALSSVIPLAIVAGLWVMRRVPLVSRPVHRLHESLAVPANSIALMYILVVVPVAIITGVTVVLFPFFASRHMLLYTPYLLIIASRGIVDLFKLSRNRLLKMAVVALMAGLLVVELASVAYSRDRLVSPVDYKGLASAWIPEIKADDIILVQPHWATTPIFYYLDCRQQYSCIGYGYGPKIQARQPLRIWVLEVGDGSQPLPPELSQALEQYQYVNDVEAQFIRAELFTPR